MAIQLSVAARNARLDSFETATGATAKLRLISGSLPASCAAAQTGTTLAEMTLPADWMAGAADGSKAKSGTWEDLSADATGTVTHFRILDNAGTTCHMQGTVTTTAVGTGDMLIDNTSVAATQSVTVTAFSMTDGNS